MAPRTLTVHVGDAWNRLKDAGEREGAAQGSSQETLLRGDRAYEALMQKTDEEEMKTRQGRRRARFRETRYPRKRMSSFHSWSPPALDSPHFGLFFKQLVNLDRPCALLSEEEIP